METTTQATQATETATSPKLTLGRKQVTETIVEEATVTGYSQFTYSGEKGDVQLTKITAKCGSENKTYVARPEQVKGELTVGSQIRISGESDKDKTTMYIRNIDVIEDYKTMFKKLMA